MRDVRLFSLLRVIERDFARWKKNIWNKICDASIHNMFYVKVIFRQLRNLDQFLLIKISIKVLYAIVANFYIS